MPSRTKPLLLPYCLGAQLERLRVRGVLMLDEVASQTFISTAEPSGMEKGQDIFQPRDVRDLIAYYQRTAEGRVNRFDEGPLRPTSALLTDSVGDPRRKEIE